MIRNRLKVLGAGAAVLSMVFSMTSIAGADDFTSSAPEPVIQSGTVNVWVVAVPNEAGVEGDTDHGGCNVGTANGSGAAPHVSASVTSSDPAVATVSPATLDFQGCGDTLKQTITITLGAALVCDQRATVTIAESSRGPGQSVKGVFNTETINVLVAGTSPTDPSCAGGGGGGSQLCSEPAAPAWAAALLKASGLKAKQLKESPNYISAVADHMTNGAVFAGVPKTSQDAYANAVRDWMNSRFGLSLASVDSARLIRPGWNCTPVGQVVS